MRYSKRIPLGVLAIAAHPHTNDGSTYRELFRAAFELARPIKIRGDEFAFIASCVDLDPETENSEITGEVHKYTEISNEDWENIKNRKAASVDDLKELKIPEHLKPNRESFRYILFPKEHRFVFLLRGEKRGISHQGMKRLLETLFSFHSIKAKFPLVSVTVEQEPDSLEQIFSIPRLDWLYIEIERPNSGDSVDEEEEKWVETLLARQAARSLKVELNHEPGKSLNPNEHNKKLARAASSYGKVKGRGKDLRNKPVKIDTSNHPIAAPFDYDKKAKSSFVDQMRVAARQLVARVIKKRKLKDE